MKAVLILASLGFWSGWWFTPDQWGDHLMKQEKYAEAAEAYADPMARGTALYRDGNFKQASNAFGTVKTAEGYYNVGNCQVMLGKYDAAIEAYDKALEIEPEWVEAQENRALAVARAAALATEGGEGTDGKLAADEIVFDENPKGSEDTGDEVVAGEELDADAQQALWMRKVKTNPGDFLKVKFAMQNQAASEGDK